MLISPILIVVLSYVQFICALDLGRAHLFEAPSAIDRAFPVLDRRYDNVEQKPTCELSGSDPVIISGRASRADLSVLKRASGKQPIAEPAGRPNKARIALFTDSFYNKGISLSIVPSHKQWSNWNVKVGDKTLLVGATGVWHPFTKTPENFVMQGLTGCTAIIILSSKGLWAGHLWEGSETIAGAGAFTERSALGDHGAHERPDDDFAAVALDIFDQITPAADRKMRPLWKSLADLRTNYGNPFQRGEDVQIFILTKAKSPRDSRALYLKKVAQLREKLAQLIPGCTITERSYVVADPEVSASSRGLIFAQYSPYDHDGEDEDCTPQARVRLSYQNNIGVIDKSWPSTNDQGGRNRRRKACNNRSSWPIKRGYVAFGDSYAAGMGTGTTTSNGCRIGTANIGDLINQHTGRSDIDYQRRICSGDTTSGLNRQIDQWTNPERADVATLTVGGNDLGFSTLVRYCVLHTDTWRSPEYNHDKCDAAKAKAIAQMDDTTDAGIGSKLSAAYEKIVKKSSRNDFHLYVSGYPGGFWNTDDLQPLDCKHSMFNYWTPSYCPNVSQGCYGRDANYLTVDLRKELNGYVSRLNDIISAAVDRVNSKLPAAQVHYVDVGPYFDHHRWCEKVDDPEKHEPNKDRAETWFFLSAWPDVDGTNVLAESTGNSDAEDNEINALMAQGSVQLPPAETCEAALDADADPNETWACMVSQGVAADPNGLWAMKFTEANTAIASKNMSAESIGWFTFTRQVRTFHPRTPGMHAYRDSIIEAINKFQGNAAVVPFQSAVPIVPPTESPSDVVVTPQQHAVSMAPAPEPPTGTTPGLGQLQCHEAFRGHRDVNAKRQEVAAQEACSDSHGHMVKAGDTSTYGHVEPSDAPGYVYDVYWTDGCVGNDIDAGKPLPDLPDTCESLLVGAYKDCNNGGAGGKIQAGCLTYEFSVVKD